MLHLPIFIATQNRDRKGARFFFVLSLFAWMLVSLKWTAHQLPLASHGYLQLPPRGVRVRMVLLCYKTAQNSIFMVAFCKRHMHVPL